MHSDNRAELALIILGLGLIGLAFLVDWEDSRTPQKDWKPRVPRLRDTTRYRDVSDERLST